VWGETRGKYAGGIARVAVSVIGLITYFVLFRERLRSRGQLKTVFFAAQTLQRAGFAPFGAADAITLSGTFRGNRPTLQSDKSGSIQETSSFCQNTESTSDLSRSL
jgi:hypothetical protein